VILTSPPTSVSQGLAPAEQPERYLLMMLPTEHEETSANGLLP